MINKLKYATISDIGVSTLFFYDSNKEEECHEFCRNNLISFFPFSLICNPLAHAINKQKSTNPVLFL